MKKILKLLFISLLFMTIKVNAASYNLVLEGITSVDKNSSIDAYIAIKNIDGFQDGILGCTASLNSSSNIKINSVSGLNGWTVLYGTGISADIYPGVTSYSRLAVVNLTVLGEGTLTLSNSYCSDGNIELGSGNSSLNYTIKQTTTTTTTPKSTTTTTTTTTAVINNTTTTTSTTTTKKNDSSSSTTTSKKKNNAFFKKIDIENYTIDFKKDNFNYNITVDNKVESINIKYELEDNKSKVEVKGSNELKIGDNIIQYIITDSNNNKNTYTIKINRESKSEYIENKEDIILEAIKGNNKINIKVNNTDNKIISNNILNALMNSKKSITYTIFEDNTKLYSISLDGNKINNIYEINYNIKFDSDFGNNIKDIIKDKKHKIINYDYSGILPDNTNVTIYNVDMKKDLYLYSYNANKNELEYVMDVKVENDNLILSLNPTSEYVLLDKKLTNTNNILFIIGTIIYVLVIAIIIVYFVICKKNNVVKKNNN